MCSHVHSTMGLVCFTARRQHAQFPGIPLPAKQLQPACGGAAALRWWSSCVDGAIAEEAPGYPRPHHMFVSCGRSQTRSAVSSLSERATPHLVTVEGRGRRACGYKVLLLFERAIISHGTPELCILQAPSGCFAAWFGLPVGPATRAIETRSWRHCTS